MARLKTVWRPAVWCHLSPTKEKRMLTYGHIHMLSTFCAKSCGQSPSVPVIWIHLLVTGTVGHWQIDIRINRFLYG